MTTTINDTIALLKHFISASQNADINSIAGLLSDEGLFEIEDDNFDLVDTSKNEYLQWYKNKLQKTTINEVFIDQCIGCSFGKQVVIFNNGTFPRVPQKFEDKTKGGILIESSEGKISKIMFCFSFLKTENNFVHDCVGKDYVKYIKQGFTEEEAIEMYDANPNSEYGYITRNIKDEE